MKRLLAGAIFGFALFAFMPSLAQADTFAGTWAVSGTLGRPVVGTVSPVCVFRQSGAAISGTCRGPNGIGSAVGAARGASIEWQWRIIATTRQGWSGIATFRGTLYRDGVIRGSWTHSGAPGYVGQFTAQHVR